MKNKNVTLEVEIWAMLCVKFVLLFLLWLYCFSNPLDKSLTSSHVSEKLFNSSINHFMESQDES